MRKVILLMLSLVTISMVAIAQDIDFAMQADLNQVYLKPHESNSLLPMSDLDMEFGYVLYQSEINVESEDSILELENVRDYAVVFIDDKLQGTLKDSKKKISLNVDKGKHQLKLYVENIGRITYGPEILDNNKGLFGSIIIDGAEIENWKMIPLNIKEFEVSKLKFQARKPNALPTFLKGEFTVSQAIDCYLDVSGWGMGEVWINNKYIGSFWEEEKQQSIQVSKDILNKGKNEVVVFEMKNTRQKTMKITNQPIFQK